MSELFREALRRYEDRSASSQAAREALALALQAAQRDAARQGTDRLTPRRINAEIAAARKAQAHKTASAAAK